MSKENFADEINSLFASSDFNFGKNAAPVDVVKEAVLKVVCGYHNGGTSQSIVMHLGYVVQGKRKYKLTDKGRRFLWWAYGDE